LKLGPLTIADERTISAMPQREPSAFSSSKVTRG
jgi:hypothetical protein